MTIERLTTVARGPGPLTEIRIPVPKPGRGQLLIRVAACGVCHTELDEIEGRTAPPRLPVVPGHQVIGTVAAVGAGVDAGQVGRRVGVAWIHSACGRCDYCRKDLENLCPDFSATGRDVHGGYAEFMLAPAAFVFSIPERFSDVQAAPLLCAGAIGYRSLELAGLEDGQPLGLTGFGASAHLVLQMVRERYPRSDVFVFARNPGEQAFARQLGAVWAGGTDSAPPCALQAIIDTTPAWKPVVRALAVLCPGGRLVINAIRKEKGDREQLLGLDYTRHLWMEKEIKSVANITRTDVRRFLALAERMQLRPEVQTYALSDANQALVDLKQRKIRGAKVLVPDD